MARAKWKPCVRWIIAMGPHGALIAIQCYLKKKVESNLIKPHTTQSFLFKSIYLVYLFFYIFLCVCMRCDAMYLCLRLHLSLAKSAHRPPRGAAGGTRSGRRRSGSRTCAVGLHRRRWWNPWILLKHGKLEHSPAKVHPIGWDQPCTKKKHERTRLAMRMNEYMHAYIYI